jgi:hypothetical protein
MREKMVRGKRMMHVLTMEMRERKKRMTRTRRKRMKIVRRMRRMRTRTRMRMRMMTGSRKMTRKNQIFLSFVLFHPSSVQSHDVRSNRVTGLL